MIIGIDVSKWQGLIDWDRVSRTHVTGLPYEGPVSFAIARVSDGITHPDRRFAENWRGMREAGIIRGVYQFLRPGQDMRSQAELLLDAVQDAGGWQLSDIAIVADVESDNPGEWSDPDKLLWWLEIIERAVGGPSPWIYTNPASWGPEMHHLAFGEYPLWIGHVGGVPAPTVPAPWKDWTAWQFTWEGHVEGISGNVDVNVYRGSKLSLLWPQIRRRLRILF